MVKSVIHFPIFKLLTLLLCFCVGQGCHLQNAIEQPSTALDENIFSPGSDASMFIFRYCPVLVARDLDRRIVALKIRAWHGSDEILCIVPKLDTVTYVSFDNTDITENGLTTLGQKTPNIDTLEIGPCNTLTSNVIERLKQFPKLKRIVLNDPNPSILQDTLMQSELRDKLNTLSKEQKAIDWTIWNKSVKMPSLTGPVGKALYQWRVFLLSEYRVLMTRSDQGEIIALQVRCEQHV